ncbi:MAG: hypothetical protein ACYTBR_11405, partial [Planctomycetota bacterium]
NLVFNASLALDCGFSDGTADTEEHLAALLDLPAWHEKSDYGRKISEDWCELVEKGREECARLRARLGYLGTGSGDPVVIIGKRIQIFEQMIRWQEKVPNMGCSGTSTEQLKREIKELRKQLSDMKK